MIYLLDTDTLIFMIRGLKPNRRSAHRQQSQKLVNRCRSAQTGGDVVGLSAITVSELEFGAHNSGDYELEITAVHDIVTPFEVFGYDAVACPHHFGRIRHDLESKGATIGAMDLLIAAHALSLNATLISNNRTHFSRVAGLRTVNWLS